MSWQGESPTSTARRVVCLTLLLVLAGCSKDGEPGSGEEAAESPGQAAETTANGTVRAGPASDECGQGGTQCPAGLECVTFREGRRQCGPPAIDAAVLITDTTLGGRCVFDEPADTMPGASIVSLQLVGTDGNAKGYGRMLWDAPGFEVAAQRGTPPDGRQPAGDACNASYNIGCDGQAVFEIVGENGDVRKLRAGDTVIVHLRGQQSCGEQVADEVEGTICSDPRAAASGNLASCASKVRMVDVRSDLYGPDRVGGTIQHIAGKEPR